MRMVYIVLFFMLCLPLGCVFEEKQANVVATVNGQAITLHTLEALQEADMSGMGIFEQFSLHELRQQYGKTLGNIIVYELIVQDLERKGLGVTQAQVQAYENTIRAEYPEGEFEKYFKENGLNIDAWRSVLRYNLAMQVFTKQVLRKDFVPSVEAVQKYYDSHKERFTLEESYDIYVASNAQRNSLQGLKKTDDLLARVEELNPLEMSLAHGEVPKSWQRLVYALKATSCTPIFKDEEHFSVICLKDHWPARMLSPEEAYVYIEEFLAEEELTFSFEKWLEQAVLTADIRISKHMQDDVR